MKVADVSKIRANGPWVLIQVEKTKKVSEGGLYLPDGNLYERLGHVVGRVLSSGKGYWEHVNGKPPVFSPTGLEGGERVVFRGHLQEANRVNDDVCFMHCKDLIGILEEGAELGLALPYDN